MKKVSILLTPIAKRWLNNHCVQKVFTATDGEEIRIPQVVDTIPIKLRGTDISLNLNRYKLNNMEEEYFVRQFIQSVENNNGVIVVKTALRFESDNRKVICSQWNYIPNRKPVMKEELV